MGQNTSKTTNIQDEAQGDSKPNQQSNRPGRVPRIKIHTPRSAGLGNARNDLVEPRPATGTTPEQDQTPTKPSQAINIHYKKTKSGREAWHQRQCAFALKHQFSRDNSMCWVESTNDCQDIPQSLLMIYQRSNREMLGKEELLDHDVLNREDTIKLVRMKAQVYLEQMTGLDNQFFEFLFHGKCHNLMDPGCFHCFNVTLSELGKLDTILTNRINTMVESVIYGNSPGRYYFQDEDQIADLLKEMPREEHRRILYLRGIFRLLGRYFEYMLDEPVIMMPENKIPRERPSHYLKQRYWDVVLWYNAGESLGQIEKDLRAMQFFASEGCKVSEFHNFNYRTYSRMFH